MSEETCDLHATEGEIAAWNDQDSGGVDPWTKEEYERELHLSFGDLYQFHRAYHSRDAEIAALLKALERAVHLVRGSHGASVRTELAKIKENTDV